MPTATVAPHRTGPANAEIAEPLDAVATLLAAQNANPFRVRAYRNAATVIRGLPIAVAELYREEGEAGLERLPQIGPGIARALRDFITLGRLPMLDRLRGEASPEDLLAGIPGIGSALAERLHHELGITTLEDLELALHDGRLASLRGFGPRRLASLSAVLAERLGRKPSYRPEPGPPVAELLSVDEEYRDRAARGELTRIAPRRFNPEGRAWLPVLHTTRGDRHYTALYSNTALAHRLGRTHDWVVLYADGGREERVATVVTMRSGPLAGRRIVRGRETESFQHYRGPRSRRPPAREPHHDAR
jgi:DNA polymerase (family 10)